MVKVDSAEDLTELQEEILVEALNNPEKSDAAIAEEVDASTSYVREVRRDLEEASELAEPENDSGSGGLFLLLIVAAVVVWWAMQNGLI